MRSVIIAVGLVAIGFAGLGVVRPARLIILTRALWQKPAAFALALAVRVLLGVALITTAPASRFPDVFYVLGLITLAAAVLGLLLGRDRLGRFVEWWLARPEPLLRVWAFIAAAFGAFLVYGVV